MKQIQWFPGHMAKARRLVEEKLKMVDIVIELLDARIPNSSRNPMLNDIIKSKPKLVILNKADLADKEQVEKWISYFEKSGIKAIRIDALNGYGVQLIISSLKEVLKDKIQRDLQKGIKERAIRAMILGIPNVGKSTLINKLAKRKATTTGDKPGVTKQQQYIRVGKELELLDTPGILWPKFDDEKVAYHLALTGAIKDTILPKDDIVIYGMKLLEQYYPGRINERYKTNINVDDVLDCYEQIGRKRGCLIRGGNVDYEKVSDIFLYDFRHQAFGKISLDRVDENV